jgi:hypothetical protein
MTRLEASEGAACLMQAVVERRGGAGPFAKGPSASRQTRGGVR